MRVALIFAIALGVVYAGPLASDENFSLEQIETAIGERNGPIESAILNLLESLRELMVKGTDTIPPLDPLVVGRIHLDDNTLPIPG
ncbi:jg18557 [Pararge aegeria aegeria]|uniref:Jg18557 protein n=1 Tax=Pararge aegeria aegeria TaxID=348720 RepID=A0A8S4QVG1_9NEOP|nr:jg18557 [Pararge aegeria aegeria]